MDYSKLGLDQSLVDAVRDVLDEAKDTVTRDSEGKVKSWSHEGDWKKTKGTDGRGKVANLSDKARKATEKMTSEELDESSVTSGEYFKKHFDKAMAAKDAGDSEKFKQHYQAAKTGRYGMSAVALTKHKDSLDKFKTLKEEVEQINELSKKTLGSYLKKSVQHYAFARKYANAVPNAKKLADKRGAGINKAVDKLTKEQVEEIEALAAKHGLTEE